MLSDAGAALIKSKTKHFERYILTGQVVHDLQGKQRDVLDQRVSDHYTSLAYL